MKGVILDCLQRMVIDQFGRDKWSAISQSVGMKPNETFLMSADVEDPHSLKLIESTCKILDMSIEETSIAFGEYWMEHYASTIYASYLTKVNNSRELLLRLDHIHSLVTKNIVNAHPPKFSYEWMNDKTLIMTYTSKRNLIDLFIGLAISVGKHYKEELTIRKLSNTQAEIVFP